VIFMKIEPSSGRSFLSRFPLQRKTKNTALLRGKRNATNNSLAEEPCGSEARRWNVFRAVDALVLPETPSLLQVG
jgi:hypothetical protein